MKKVYLLTVRHPLPPIYGDNVFETDIIYIFSKHPPKTRLKKILSDYTLSDNQLDTLYANYPVECELNMVNVMLEFIPLLTDKKIDKEI